MTNSSKLKSAIYVVINTPIQNALNVADWLEEAIEFWEQTENNKECSDCEWIPSQSAVNTPDGTIPGMICRGCDEARKFTQDDRISF